MRILVATGRSGRGPVQRGQASIEQMFCHGTMKQKRPVRRLTAMQSPIHVHRPIRPVALTALRTTVAVVLAMLLILVVLPAIIAAQAASI